jgi:DNA polymerase-3 subunit alpha
MAQDFAWRPDALANTLDIASRCEGVFPPLRHLFPAPPVESGDPLDEVFAARARQGLERRLERLAAVRRDFTGEDAGRYRARLEEEIGVINSRQYPGYFLIVADFIGWAKSRSIPVGPGRGSAVGSLAAWALGITDIDPIRYDLLFERFLNPERPSLPDIDVDFCAEGRAEVIRYVTETYGGGDYVGQICAMGQLKARAVVRDVGRVLDLELPLVDSLAKRIPSKLGITLAEAMESAPEIREMAAKDPRVARTLDYALLLENLPRHASTHASGVVISDRPLMDVLPLFSDAKSPEENGRRVQVSTQYELGAVEANGLVKFDFLGLKTLTLIKHCLRILAERGVEVDLDSIDLADPLPYELMASGDVTGVFQIENRGIREVVTRLRPTCLEDVIAVVALYRPGPLKSGMVDDYIRIKHGLTQAHYELDILRPIL